MGILKIDRDKLFVLYNKGLTAKEMSIKLNCKPISVYAALYSINLSMPSEALRQRNSYIKLNKPKKRRVCVKK